MLEMNKRSFDADSYFFHSGTARQAYEFMGVHKEGDSFVFRTWAPNAHSAFVTGSFNGWSEQHPMRRVTDAGIWEAVISADTVTFGDQYKYLFYNGADRIFKADPYGYRMTEPPYAASVVTELAGYEWHDKGWLEQRSEVVTLGKGFYAQPMNIYEIHLGSWKRHEDGSYYSYREIADDLAPYVKQMGYTHVELMPVMEHPFDGSWGYQVGGYYAPTARYGSAHDLMRFIDTMHGAGIGVILDWVPAHFPKDQFGLYEFDGQPLYEYQGLDRMENRGWGTRRFDVGREEVQSFLVSNAVYWAKEYHADGLRVDAVTSMIYLDYDREEGEWLPNIFGDNRCLEAIAFFKKLNTSMKEVCPDVLMIAEESSAWKGITSFEGENALGFDLKWNMGWMNDTLSYAEQDPIYRKFHHDKVTFPMMYAFNEKYILPISHDEVVHGKKSFLDKMPGDYWKKFAGARVFEAYRMTMPGKKLTFMGNEIGQFREWAYADDIEWFLLDYESHARHQLYLADLNNLYLKYPELWQVDDSWKGFQWIDADNKDASILSYRRIAENGKELIVVLNFTPVAYEDHCLRVPTEGSYKEIFNSDDPKYGGSGVTNTGVTFQSTRDPIFGSYSEGIRLRVPPLGATVLQMTRKRAARAASAAKSEKAPKSEKTPRTAKKPAKEKKS